MIILQDGGLSSNIEMFKIVINLYPLKLLDISPTIKWTNFLMKEKEKKFFNFLDENNF